MKEKELKRLGRAELLELLLTQTRETERLQSELEKLKAELSDRRLRIEKAGTLAQAVMDINGVMEAAQAAAGQYLENIAEMEKETREKCAAMLVEAEAEAARMGETIIAKAKAEAARIREGASKTGEGGGNVPDDVLIEEIYELIGEKHQ